MRSKFFKRIKIHCPHANGVNKRLEVFQSYLSRMPSRMKCKINTLTTPSDMGNYMKFFGHFISVFFENLSKFCPLFEISHIIRKINSIASKLVIENKMKSFNVQTKNKKILIQFCTKN